MTWQRFRCIIDCDEFPDDCISEKLIKEQATRLAEDGWLEAGYSAFKNFGPTTSIWSFLRFLSENFGQNVCVADFRLVLRACFMGQF